MTRYLTLVVILLAVTVSRGQSDQDWQEVNVTLDRWHDAATDADFEKYFDLMTADGVFIGTDASENWQNEEFRSFAKPYFDEGKAWSFSAVERNIYFDESGKLAWFDELLDTRMGICRGSGVVISENGAWRIAHYVLSIAVPNNNVDALIELKKEHDSTYLKTLKGN